MLEIFSFFFLVLLFIFVSHACYSLETNIWKIIFKTFIWAFYQLMSIAKNWKMEWGPLECVWEICWELADSMLRKKVFVFYWCEQGNMFAAILRFAIGKRMNRNECKMRLKPSMRYEYKNKEPAKLFMAFCWHLLFVLHECVYFILHDCLKCLTNKKNIN